jgi:hypothetical protein
MRAGNDSLKCRRVLLKGNSGFRGWYRQCQRRSFRTAGIRAGFGSQSHRSFLRFRFPIRATKALRRSAVPFRRVGIIRRSLKIFRQFEGHHGVVSFFIQRRKLARRIFGSSCASNARGDLFPICHKGACIVTAVRFGGQQCEPTAPQLILQRPIAGSENIQQFPR